MLPENSRWNNPGHNAARREAEKRAQRVVDKAHGDAAQQEATDENRCCDCAYVAEHARATCPDACESLDRFMAADRCGGQTRKAGEDLLNKVKTVGVTMWNSPLWFPVEADARATTPGVSSKDGKQLLLATVASAMLYAPIAFGRSFI